MKEKKGFIYLISGNGLYKIGFSTRINHRLNQIRSNVPFDIEILFTKEINNPKLCERQLHFLFKKNRVRGEWFSFSEKEVKDVIETMKKVTGVYFKNIASNLRYEELKKIREQGATYQELANEFGMSRQRAHQILKKGRLSDD